MLRDIFLITELFSRRFFERFVEFREN
jgi:hypothetical protein